MVYSGFRSLSPVGLQIIRTLAKAGTPIKEIAGCRPKPPPQLGAVAAARRPFGIEPGEMRLENVRRTGRRRKLVRDIVRGGGGDVFRCRSNGQRDVAGPKAQDARGCASHRRRGG